ncbi:MAG: hypothetical protein V1755_12000 [Chloroflexota bacterium]
MNGPAHRQQLLQQRSQSLEAFARGLMGISLRPYQLEAAQAVLSSIAQNAGRSIVIMFARQSGKDELSANLKAFLLTRTHRRETGIVEVNPTYKPQTINAIERFEARLRRNRLTRRHWRKRSDFIRFVGRARVTFLSGDAKANVVGAVASMLLIVNEAQDVAPAVYDRNFAPMAASTNATRLFMGTAWTSHTLLARELRAARQAEQADGIRRVFLYDAEDVRAVVPAYGAYVDGQIARLGRGHPLIRTQYFNEEIDAQAGMFTPARRAMMHCDSVDRGDADAYVFALDVAGQDEATFHSPEEQMLRNPGRDSVSLTIASVDLSAMDTLQAPIFRIVRRVQWTGLNHLAVFGKLSALVDQWGPQHIVVDATGVGEGLWAMLDKRYPTRVLPVKFSAQKKSELGYRFLAMIETGRLRDCSGERAAGPHRPLRSHEGPESPAAHASVTRAMVDMQYGACISDVPLGPHRTLRWGVPEGTRDPDGNLIHDDIVMADALLAEADALEWSVHTPTLIVRPNDPLEEMSHFRE